MKLRQRRTSTARSARRRSFPAPDGRHLRPVQALLDRGSAGPKPISMRVPIGNSTLVARTTVVVPSRSGRSSIRRSRVMTASEPPDASTAPATTRRPLPSAPRCRQPQQLGGDHRAGDAEQAGDLFGRAVDAGAVVLDEEPVAIDLADVDLGAGVERVVGDLFEYQPAQPGRRDAGLLLQAFDGAEQRPVLALEFQIRGRR